MTYLVLHVRSYDFKDDASGRQVVGSTVTYLDLTMQSNADQGEQGFAPLQLSVDTALSRDFSQVPGYYELDFRQRRGANGKPVLVLSGAKLDTPVNLRKPQPRQGVVTS